MRNKKALVYLSVVLLFLGSSLLGQLVGSSHDFSMAGWNHTGEICTPCHSPQKMGRTNSAVWTRTIPTTYIPYSSSTMNASPGQPSEVSRLCLSCHDGTIAVDNFDNKPGFQYITYGSPGYLGSDLSKNHPISFVYDSALALADGELYDPGSPAVAALLFNGKVECVSCHDVHNKDVAGSGYKLLRIDGSRLCLTCHIK